MAEHEGKQDIYAHHKTQLTNFLDTYDPRVQRNVGVLFNAAPRAGTISRMSAVEYVDPTGTSVLDFSIRRVGLLDDHTAEERAAKKEFDTALSELTTDVKSAVRIISQEINDEDTEGNIQRGLVALDANNRPKATVVFESVFINREPGVYSQRKG